MDGGVESLILILVFYLNIKVDGGVESLTLENVTTLEHESEVADNAQTGMFSFIF